MKRMLGYLKPFVLMIAATIILLFTQTVLNLLMPDLMSDIVNVGLQRSGISAQTPTVLSEEHMAQVRLFMTDEEKAAADAHYTLVTPADATADQLADVPVLADGPMYFSDGAKGTGFENALYALSLYKKSEGTLAGEIDISAAQKADIASYVTAAAQASVSAREAGSATLLKTMYDGYAMNTVWMQTRYILFTGLKMLAVAALTVVASIGIGFCASRTGAGLSRNMRSDMFRRVEHFSSEEIDRFSTASLITRTTNDVSQVQMLVQMGMRMIVSAPIMAIGGVIMALKKSPSQAWLIGLAVACLIAMVCTIFSFTVPRFSIIQKLTDRLNLVMRENLSGMLVIRAFGSQEFELGRFDEANSSLTRTQKFVARVSGLMGPGMTIIQNGLTLLIVWLGARQIAASNLLVGDMMAFISYATQIVASFMMLSFMSMMLPRALVSIRRINEVMDTTPTITDPEAPAAIPEKVREGLSFNDVSFRFPGADDDAVSHVSFTAKPGETVAFIGATGAGKTALMNLIPRFYDVTEGSITLDGTDIRNFTQHDLRSKIGYVPQKGVLFTGDIASNLRFGNENATDEELKTVARVAQADAFISTMPEGYDSLIAQGGTNVSGGQRQRLSIARALMTNADVYIFDDSFSALDFKTDAALRHALADHTKDAILLIVAQRIGTIMTADRIVVMDHGEAVGIGTHEELLRTCDTYREIAQSQLSQEELA